MNAESKFTLRRERLNAQGYTSSGCYFGVDAPLFWFCSDDGKHDGYIRASDRAAAKAKIREKHPTARFYN